ncbi:MAG: metallophosphoesterase, partial [Alphaproteobacteria bacterium]
MLRIAHLTDPHVTAPQHRLCGLHTPTMLRRALAAVAARPAGFYDAVVITGDLTDRGEPAAYEELARCLEGVAPPVYLIIGNHDDREAFRAVFADEPRYAAGDFVQYAIDDFAPHRLVFLDTNVPGTARGLLCDQRLAWLDEALAERPEA